jgi:Mrp family chromosome partitioning ATPase
VSGVVIVSRIGVTTRDAARQLREQLTKLKAPTLGVVANAASPALRYGHYRAEDPPRSGVSASDVVSEQPPARVS